MLTDTDIKQYLCDSFISYQLREYIDDTEDYINIQVMVGIYKYIIPLTECIELTWLIQCIFVAARQSSKPANSGNVFWTQIDTMPMCYKYIIRFDS